MFNEQLDEKFALLVHKSISWNIENLPFNTLLMQQKKVDEEIKELEEALKKQDTEEILKEFADVFIATCGLGRFSTFLLGEQLPNLFTSMKTQKCDEFILNCIVEAIENKLNILEQRKYSICDGVYHHVDQ